MNHLPLTYILQAGFLCLGAFAGGAAFTAKLVNDQAGLTFLLLGATWFLIGVSGLLWLRRFARHRAVGHLFFMALFVNVGLMPMLFALALPLLWLHGVFSVVGGTLIGYFLTTLVYQLYKAYLHFAECWEKNHERSLADLYNPSLGVIHIEPFLGRLQVQADLFLPVKSESLKGIISLALVLSMIVGLNLRKVFPEFSAYAWGIPSLTMTTVCLQMAFLRILLALKIRDLEKNSGRHIGPMPDGEIQRLKPRKRKAKSK